MKRATIQHSTDSEIRSALHKKILRRDHFHPRTVVINELGVGHGKSRVDVAVLNGCLHGYEIKSSKDTLERLPFQLAEYSRCLEKLTFVVAPNHLADISQLIPKWCGLIVAHVGPRGGINFKVLRRTNKNPNVEITELSRLLWKKEVIDYLALLGVDSVSSKAAKDDLYRCLAEKITLRELTSFIKDCFMSRETWRAGLRPLSYDGSFPPVSK